MMENNWTVYGPDGRPVGYVVPPLPEGKSAFTQGLEGMVLGAKMAGIGAAAFVVFFLLVVIL